MAFSNNYHNLVAEQTQAHTRLIRDYDGSNKDFDFIIIGSGIGGGILADDLADRLGRHKRILVLEAGSFIYPTHVYNISRIPNFSVAKHFGVVNFSQTESATHKIGEEPQMAFGGRSIFWSGLIPQVQSWELNFFPDKVRDSLVIEFLQLAGEQMNESLSLGKKAKEIVTYFQNSDLGTDFEIRETPRALHQPYLNADGTPKSKFYENSTGVFNTAELLINQVGLTPGTDQDKNGLFIKLNSFVEGIHHIPHNWYEVKTTNTITGYQKSFYTPKVIIAAGSLESPKLINRSDIYHQLPNEVKKNIGFGLTDHPVTSESQAYVSSLGEQIPLSRDDHAKIIFYSKGALTNEGSIKYPFNIEMNVNHEYWHLRDNDFSIDLEQDDTAKTRVDIKFSFANCLDDENGIFSHSHDGYKPEISFKRFSNINDLLHSRFPAVAGWQKNHQEFFDLLNTTRNKIFNEFKGLEYLTGEYGYGNGKQWPFGWGTVHHACGTLRMPWRSNLAANNFNHNSVVDEDLKVRGSEGIFVCDMSVMPISTAANPVRTLAALALRLSRHLG